MFTQLNTQVRKILFLIALIAVYAFVLPADIRSILGAFAVGWASYDIASKLFD